MNGGIINKIRILSDLIRLPNLIFLAYLQLSIFTLFVYHNISGSLSRHQYLIGILLPTLIIMAFGNVFNDYCDFKSDIINNKRPSANAGITRSILKYISVLLVTTSLMAILLSHYFVAHWTLTLTLLLVVLILYVYSTSLKKVALLGNLSVATLAVIGMYLPLLLISLSQMGDLDDLPFLICFAALVFFYTLVREIYKDIEDYIGDKRTSHRTFPIIYGKEASFKLISILTATNAALIGLLIYTSKTEMAICVFIFAALPLLIFCILHFRYTDATVMSKFLKVQMLLASIILVTYKFI